MHMYVKHTVLHLATNSSKYTGKSTGSKSIVIVQEGDCEGTLERPLKLPRRRNNKAEAVGKVIGQDGLLKMEHQ